MVLASDNSALIPVKLSHPIFQSTGLEIVMKGKQSETGTDPEMDP